MQEQSKLQTPTGCRRRLFNHLWVGGRREVFFGGTSRNTETFRYLEVMRLQRSFVRNWGKYQLCLVVKRESMGALHLEYKILPTQNSGPESFPLTYANSEKL